MKALWLKFRMRCANVTAYLLTLQDQHDLAREATDTEHRLHGALQVEELNKRLGGLRGDHTYR